MKVTIHDRSPFESLNPTDVAAYLTTTGWKEVERKPGHSSVWRHGWNGESVDLLMPLNRAIPDYPLRMAEAAQLIAAVENRSELETLHDLQTAGVDIAAALEDAEITGYVVKLQRDEGQGPLIGSVTVAALVDDQMRKVVIELAEADHQKAVTAYQRGVRVLCRGDLVKQGQLWTLRNPQGLALIGEE